MAPMSPTGEASLRAPQEGDWPAVLELANASVASLPEAGTQEEWLQNRRGFDPRGGVQHHLVSVRGGVVLGYGAIESGAGPDPSSYRMYVVTRPELYATVGEQLYQALIGALRQRGATEAWLIEYVGDRAALPFVLERGFREHRRMTLPDGREAVVVSRSLASVGAP